MRIPRLPLYTSITASLLVACSAGGASPPLQQQSASTRPLAVNAAIQYPTPQFKAVLLPSGFIPVAMMKDGQIPGSFGAGAAIYRNGKLVVLGQYNGQTTVATSVNSLGVAVGYASGTATAPAVEYANGKFSALPHVKNCQYADEADTINDVGDVYGTCFEFGESDSPQIARYRPGTPSLISGPFSGRGAMFNVNSSGTFVYSGYFFANDAMAAAYGTNLTAIALFPKLRWSQATWINDAGTVVGWRSNSTTASPFPERPYEYPKGGPVKLLPMLTGATFMRPDGINKFGTIVGDWDNGVFLYKSGVMYDITNTTAPSLSSAYPGLSDSGGFVANGTDGRIYLIVPV
jgi:hypothetical protein